MAGETRSLGDHCKSLLARLNTQRKDKGEFCDITLCAQGKRFPAHKAVIAASSEFFAAMWTHSFSEGEQGFVDFKDIQEDIVEILLDFIYTGELKISQENVLKLLAAANMLGLDGAKRLCEDFLWHNLTKTNCLQTLCFAEKYSCDYLQGKSRGFVADFFEKLSKTVGFLELSKDALVYLLSTDEMRISSEESVFLAVLRWIDAREGRVNFLSELMKCVKLSLISTVRLKLHIRKFRFLRVEQHFLQSVVEERNLKEVKLREQPRSASTFFLLGGGGMDFRSFSVLSGKWQELPPLDGSPFRKMFGLAAVGNCLYVIGGRIEGVAVDDDTTDVDCFNIDQQTWSKAASLNYPRHDLSVCVLGEAIYALGGYSNFHTGTGSGYSDTVEVFYPKEKRRKWQELPSMPSSSYGFHLTAGLDNKLYVLSCGMMSSCEKIHIFDIRLKEWSTVSLSVTFNAYAGIATAGGYIFLACDDIGGHLQFDFKLQVVTQESSFKRLDVSDLSIEETSPMTGNVSYRKISGTGNYVYVFDGMNVHRFDVRNNMWDTVSGMCPGEFDNSYDKFEVALAVN